jgi:hypothetical protein
MHVGYEGVPLTGAVCGLGQRARIEADCNACIAAGADGVSHASLCRDAVFLEPHVRLLNTNWALGLAVSGRVAHSPASHWAQAVVAPHSSVSSVGAPPERRNSVKFDILRVYTSCYP